MSRYRIKAAALRYSAERDPAPVVVAAGYGEAARRIISIAEEQGIAVFRDDSAASLLCMLEVGTAIPEELYQIIAAIYAQIIGQAQKIQEGKGPVAAR